MWCKQARELDNWIHLWEPFMDIANKFRMLIVMALKEEPELHGWGSRWSFLGWGSVAFGHIAVWLLLKTFELYPSNENSSEFQFLIRWDFEFLLDSWMIDHVSALVLVDATSRKSDFSWPLVSHQTSFFIHPTHPIKKEFAE